MAARFQTVRRRARFQGFGEIGPDAMQRIAEATRASILARIQRGETVNDTPARPLQMKYREKYVDNKLQRLGADRGYRAQKMRKGGKPIRDWTYTGHTLRCLKVLWVSGTKAAIGFLDAVFPGRPAKNRITAAQIAAIRNRDERQFGISPKDRAVLQNAVAAELHNSSVTKTGAA